MSESIWARARRQAVERIDVVRPWAEAMAAELQRDVVDADPYVLERIVPLMDLWSRWFDGEARGFDTLPSGPLLLVGNHSGGTLTPDTTVLLSNWYRHRGLDDPLVGLAFSSVFGIPVFKDLMRGLGFVPASHGNAQESLERGRSVLVYPGGEHEVFRPWKQRAQITFNERKGFIKLALRAGVPVVPVVGWGGHDTLLTLSRGYDIARRLRLDRIRVNIFPIVLQAPWGVSPGIPGLPLPAKITVEALTPMNWHQRFGADDADDPDVLEACYREITDRMQDALTALSDQTPNPLATRMRSWMRRNS